MTIVQHVNSSIINRNTIIITIQSSVTISYKTDITTFFKFMEPKHLLLFKNTLHN